MKIDYPAPACLVALSIINSAIIDREALTQKITVKFDPDLADGFVDLQNRGVIKLGTDFRGLLPVPNEPAYTTALRRVTYSNGLQFIIDPAKFFEFYDAACLKYKGLLEPDFLEVKLGLNNGVPTLRSKIGFIPLGPKLQNGGYPDRVFKYTISNPGAEICRFDIEGTPSRVKLHEIARGWGITKKLKPYIFESTSSDSLCLNKRILLPIEVWQNLLVNGIAVINS